MTMFFVCFTAARPGNPSSTAASTVIGVSPGVVTGTLIVKARLSTVCAFGATLWTTGVSAPIRDVTVSFVMATSSEADTVAVTLRPGYSASGNAVKRSMTGAALSTTVYVSGATSMNRPARSMTRIDSEAGPAGASAATGSETAWPVTDSGDPAKISRRSGFV